MPTGTVSRLWRWPVKSMAGEELRALSLGPRGVGGDRTHAVLHEHKGEWRPLTARESPRLLAWRAGYAEDGGTLDPAAPPLARITAPDGRAAGWDDAGLAQTLGADLGRPVRLRRDPAGIQDLGRSLLITVEATRIALGAELGTELDLRRFRPNVHLVLDSDPWAEHGWEGGRLEFAGGVVADLLHPCERCAIPTRDPATQRKWPLLLRHLAREHDTLFGINARVTTPGRIADGEAVRLAR